MTRYGSESGGLPPSRWQGQAPGGSSCDVSASLFMAAPVWDGSAIVRPHTVGRSGFFYMMMIWDGDRWVLGGHIFPLKRGHRATPAFTRLPYFRVLCVWCFVLLFGVEQFPPKKSQTLASKKERNPCIDF